MASKRAVRCRACEGKHRYPSQQAAQARLAHHTKGHGFEGMHCYRCQFCRQFHLGHPPKEVRQAKIAKHRSK